MIEGSIRDSKSLFFYTRHVTSYKHTTYMSKMKSIIELGFNYIQLRSMVYIRNSDFFPHKVLLTMAIYSIYRNDLTKQK